MSAPGEVGLCPPGSVPGQAHVLLGPQVVGCLERSQVGLSLPSRCCLPACICLVSALALWAWGLLAGSDSGPGQSPLTAPFVLWPPSLLLRASLPFPPGPTGTSLAPALLSRQTTCWRVGFDRTDPCLIAVETLPPDPCPSTALFPSFLQRRGS